MSTGVPKVTVVLGNGNLERTAQTDDGVVALVITGATVAGAGNVTEGESYQIFSLDEAEAMGITEGGTNDFAWQQLKAFYGEAKTGAELWLMIVGSAVLMTTMVDETEDYAKKLLDDAKGRVRMLFVSKKSLGTETISGGLDEDVHNAVPEAQTLAETYTAINRPLRVIIDGKDFNGTVADLTDYSSDTKNRTAIFISNTDGTANASIGLLMGRLGAIPVQRKPGRVKDGSIASLAAYFTNEAAVETLEASWDAIQNKGYIFLMSYVGKAGYFVSKDPTLTANTDDYNSIARGRVIDKAHILAFSTFVDELLEEIPIDTDGKIHPALVKNWEAKVENTINQQMTANGEISGCEAYIDPEQNVLSTDEIKVTLSILPVGYAEKITVTLGFTTTLNN